MFKAKKLLEKEEEFVKLNAELDLETKDLMERVDQVMVCEKKIFFGGLCREFLILFKFFAFFLLIKINFFRDFTSTKTNRSTSKTY